MRTAHRWVITQRVVITSVRSYHYSLPDNPENTSSHNFWVSSNDKVIVKRFVKKGKIFP